MAKPMNVLQSTFGLASLCALLAGGCAMMSIREDDNLQKYPAASRLPLAINACGSWGVDRGKIIELSGPEFYSMGGITVTNVKGYEDKDACSALKRKAQESGAQIVVGEYETRDKGGRAIKWEYGKTPVIHGGDWVSHYVLELDGRLYVYDPDRVKKEAQDHALGIVTKLEEGTGDFAGLRDPKAFRKPEMQARWRQDLAQLRNSIQQGRNSEAKQRTAELRLQVDGCYKSYMETPVASKVTPDNDDRIIECTTQKNIYYSFGHIDDYLDTLKKIDALPKKDPELALRQFEERVRKWRDESMRVDKEKMRVREKRLRVTQRVMREKLSKLEKAVKSYDMSGPGWANFYSFYILLRSGYEKKNASTINSVMSTPEQDYRHCWNYDEKKDTITVTKECQNMKDIIEPIVDINIYYRNNEEDMF